MGARPTSVLLFFAALCACDQADPPGQPAWASLENRLFDGAPPVIPHQVAELGRGQCLDCHLRGDAVDGGLRAGATPHPQLTRCQQCHVERTDSGDFQQNRYESAAYATGSRAHSASPRLIPHPLTMREDCLACHGERGIYQELRTTHPERLRCTQCHLPAEQDWPGPRPDLETDPWIAVPSP